MSNAKPNDPGPTVIPPKVFRWLLLIPAILSLAAFVVASTRTREAHALASETNALSVQPVAVVRPVDGSPTTTLTIPATLQAFREAAIFARSSGYLERWTYDVGAHVHKGQQLALIGSPELDQQFRQTQALLAQARSNLDLARLTAQRYSGLRNTEAVSLQEIDQANNSMKAQEAAVVAAEADMKRLEALRSFEAVVAPFDGIITRRNTDVGDLVNAGGGQGAIELFHLSGVETMRTFIHVPEAVANQVRPGLPVSMHVLASSGVPFTGHVVRATHAIESSSHTMLVEVDLPNANGTLMPGAYAQVTLTLPNPLSTLTIPTESVLYQSAGPQVAMVRDGAYLRLQSVTLGQDFGSSIEVLHGISKDDVIVSSPPDYVVDGMHVAIVTAPR